MNYHNITKEDVLNGDGIRVVLWVSGCEHHCSGCQNPCTWDPDSGLPFIDAAKNEIYEELDKDYVSGITFSGGDPLHPLNRDTIELFIIEFKKKFPNKTVWMYTGYKWEEIKDLPIVALIDVLVDGKFDIEKLDKNLCWKGSSNQRVIKAKETITKKYALPLLHCPDYI